MSSSFKNKNLYGDYYPSSGESFDNKKIKELTKSLCKSYKEGLIPEETFQELIKKLLMFYVEHRVEDKLLSKSQKFEDRIFRVVSSINW